jgi:pSer/pThr/pTyr-binding forkhead associated (FHA) protein
MDVFERFNTKFGKWYEGLFGGDTGELRPKDVLRKITAAMEDSRKEGFDNKIYVPNKYVLELAVDDPEERDYLLSFLDEEELVSVLQRFMAQNHYHARGPLDFTIAEVPATERDAHREKLRVKVRFEKGEIAPPPPSSGPPPPSEVERRQAQRAVNASPTADPAMSGSQWPLSTSEGGGGPKAGWGPSDDLPTVAGVDLDDEPGTVPAVAWASLAVTGADGRKSNFSLTKPIVTIGRSRNAANDLVLDSDGMVSKAHARLERERDGRWTAYDLGSTNGIKVGGQRIDGNRVLTDGDQIVIGATVLVFQESGREEKPAAVMGVLRRGRLVTANGEEYVLASETLIGRAVTSDLVLDDPGVSTRHARIIAPDAVTYDLEDLDSAGGTWLNGQRLAPRLRTRLADGDRLRIGGQELRFQAGASQ